MSSPTSIEVTCDDTEYSRYESTRNRITATVICVGGGSYTSEVVNVDLVKARRSRDSVVATASITFNGAAPHEQEVEFYLPDIVDGDLLNLVRHGSYFVRASSVSDPLIIGESSEIQIRIITTSLFKDKYLFGLKLSATEVKLVKNQPVSITGVQVVEVSSAHMSGFGTLAYTYTATPSVVRTLSWRGGTPVTITAPGNYTLRAGTTIPGGCSPGFAGDYIVVKIKSLALLPTTSISEDLLIDGKVIDDSTLANYIDSAISWIEKEILYCYLEPTRTVTERDASAYQYSVNSSVSAPIYLETDYDYIGTPLTYFPQGPMRYVSINMPYKQLLRVEYMYGALANERVLDIDMDWIQFSISNGLVQLVPYNAQVGFTYAGLIWNGTLHSYNELPSFWRYSVVSGLRDVSPDLLDLIGKKAAMDALIMLGLALRPGMGSVSLSRDGVSQSTSYITGKYGPYTPAIQMYADFLEKEIPRYRAQYRGTMTIVV